MPSARADGAGVANRFCPCSESGVKPLGSAPGLAGAAAAAEESKAVTATEEASPSGDVVCVSPSHSPTAQPSGNGFTPYMREHRGAAQDTPRHNPLSFLSHVRRIDLHEAIELHK